MRKFSFFVFVILFSNSTFAYDNDIDNDGIIDYNKGGVDRDLDNDGYWDTPHDQDIDNDGLIDHDKEIGRAHV